MFGTNICCCVCTTDCDDPFTRANHSDPNVASPAGCGWTEITGVWDIVSNLLRVSSPDAKILSSAALPEEFVVSVAVNSAAGGTTRDEYILYLDDNKIVFSFGAVFLENNRVTWIPVEGETVTGSNVINSGGFGDGSPRTLSAVRVDGDLYIRVTGTVTGLRNILKIENVPVFTTVALGTGNLVSTGWFDNFVIQSTPAICTTYADPNWCSVFYENWTGHNGGTRLGSHWAEQSGTMTFGGFFVSSYLTLTDATIVSQPLYWPDNDYKHLIVQLTVTEIASTPATVTLTLGDIEIVLRYNPTGGCDCMTIDDTNVRSGIGTTHIWEFDNENSSIWYDANLCKADFTFDEFPEELEIQVEGSIRIDFISITTRREGVGNPADCVAVFEHTCDCSTLSHSVCDVTQPSYCNLDFDGSWTINSSTDWDGTTGAIVHSNPGEFYYGPGNCYVSTGLELVTIGDTVKVYTDYPDVWIEIVAGAAADGVGATIQCVGGELLTKTATNSVFPIQAARQFGLELYHRDGYVAARIGSNFYAGSGPVYHWYAFGFAADPISNAHAAIEVVSGTCNVASFTVIGSEGDLSYPAFQVEWRESTTDCCDNILPVVCGEPNIISCLVTVEVTIDTEVFDDSVVEGCLPTLPFTDSVVVECFARTSSNGSYIFFGEGGDLFGIGPIAVTYSPVTGSPISEGASGSASIAGSGVTFATDTEVSNCEYTGLAEYYCDFFQGYATGTCTVSVQI